MTAPTEAEIRQTIAADEYAWGLVSDAFSAIAGTLDGLYDSQDLRKSELEDLDTCASTALEVMRVRVTEDITEALVAGALAFAARHPDAPRPVREPVTV